jgi:hypothetical protein
MAEKIVVGGPKIDPPKRQWHKETDPAIRAQELLQAVRYIENRQSSIASGNRRHAEVYSAYVPVGLSWSGPGGYVRPTVQATRNVVRSVVDTAHALISKSWPRPRVITMGGNWEVQRKAKLLDQFLVGAYARAHVYEEAQSAFRDACIFGTGAYILRERTEPDYHIECERILIDDLVVDEEECPSTTKPRNWYLRRVMPVDEAVSLYGKGDEDREDKIRAAAGKTVSTWTNQMSIPPNCVMIVESWHLKAGKKDKSIHCVATEGIELLCEKWPHPWAPIVVLYWSPPISGFYGDGVAYRQYGRQKRINYLYRWIQRCQDLIAVPRVWVDSSNGPLKVQLSNEIGEIVGVHGAAPTFQTPQAVGQEIYRWLDELEAGGFEDEGISQMSASNQLPQGIESAPAQREYSFKEGQRFAPVSQRWETAVAKTTSLMMLAMYKEHADPEATVAWSSRKLVQIIPWDEVDMMEDAYEIRVEASSIETLSPAGRLQAAIELSQAGFLTDEEARRLLGHPDLERTDAKINAAIEYAEWISMELKAGKYHPPCEYGDIKLQAETVKADLQTAETLEAPERILQLMRQFLRDCDAKINPPTPPGAAPGAMGGPADSMMMPPGIGAAPAPAMSLAAAQGLAPMAGTGASKQNV